MNVNARLGWSLACALATLPAHAQINRPDTEDLMKERDWREAAITLPEFPQAERLVEFYVSASTSFRFFIDPKTLMVGDDGVIRYVLVARSASGARNVSFEGIRCKTGEFKQYATGRDDASWVERRGAEWVPIDSKTVNRQHQALRSEYFCPRGVPIHTAAEGIDALRRAGHPNAKDQLRN